MKIKNNKKHSKKLFIISITMFFIGIYISFKYLENKDIKTNDNINNLLLEYNFSNKTIKEALSSLEKEEVVERKKEPLIYIYNTHDTEEYSPNELFSITPNVSMVNYILKEQFETNNIDTIVEERSVKEILNMNNWNYASSYKASRLYLEDTKNTYNSLKYFIDIHRDSLPKNRTTIEIDNKSYASILFIVGLENDNWNSNYEFTEKLHNKLNELYPNISKGILKKAGPGVNGVYNQDFSPYTILIEVGGNENNTYEVLNSSLAIAKCFMEIINEEDN